MKQTMLYLLALTLFTPLAWADRAGEILTSVENRLIGDQAPKDMSAEMRMVIRKGTTQKERSLQAWTKNNAGADDHRVMKFLTPADVKGIALLVLAEDQMYIYMPEFKRTRRIASSNRKDAFVGSDFSYEDLSTSGFSAFYEVRLIQEDADSADLELTPKAGVSKPYARVEMVVDKKTMLPSALRMYDKSGKLWKDCAQESTAVGPYRVISRFLMKDLAKGSQTELTLLDIRVDQNLPPETFTERFLKK
jgi:outer membrane lipoprotein-sorting protein